MKIEHLPLEMVPFLLGEYKMTTILFRGAPNDFTPDKSGNP
jgi:hypothetical protein